MAPHVTADIKQPTFAPGTVVTYRGRLWRVDAQQGDVLVTTSIDSGQPEQYRFYLPFEDVQPGRLEPPSPDVVGHRATQDLLLRAYCLSLLYSSTPLLSLQRSRVIPQDYQADDEWKYRRLKALNYRVVVMKGGEVEAGLDDLKERLGT